MSRPETPTCCTGWKQVTDDCPVCGPNGPCQEEPDRVKPSRQLGGLVALAFRRFAGVASMTEDRALRVRLSVVRG